MVDPKCVQMGGHEFEMGEDTEWLLISGKPPSLKFQAFTISQKLNYAVSEKCL
jgi:hypothetical protein